MRGFLPVFKREIVSLFVTPTAWILIVVFLVLQGFHFYGLVVHFSHSPELSVDQGPVQAFFGESIVFYLPLVLLCPAITMRLFAEERRSGTIETLLTAPVATPGVVLGKYAAAVATYAAMWAPTLLYVVVIRRAGEVDWHVVGSSYAGVLLVGAGYLAIGTLGSAMGRSQLVALVLAALAILGLFVVGIGEYVFDPGVARDACAYVSVWGQMQELSKGIVDSRRLVLDASLVALPLFATVRAVDADRPRGHAAWGRAIGTAGVAAAAVVCVLGNVIAARHYRRWDVTTHRLYTLSPATVTTLRGLGERVECDVLLSSSDPLAGSLRFLLGAYGAETDRLDVRWIDPDRNAAEFLAVQQRHGILAGRTQDGRIVTDAALVISRAGTEPYFVSAGDLVDAGEGDEARARSRVEQALTTGIRSVLRGDRPRVCFTTGHGEKSLDDGSPRGLGEFGSRLRKNNYEPVTWPLGPQPPPQPASSCRVIAIVGPSETFSPDDAGRVRDYLVGGGSVAILAGPVPDGDRRRILPHGLGPVAEAGGIALDDDFVFELDAARKLPGGLGEQFFAEPRPHDVTAGLVGARAADVHILMIAARSLSRTSASGAPAALPTDLLATSGEAFGMTDFFAWADKGGMPAKGAGDRGGPLVVAMASELPRPKGSTEAHGPRLVVVGSSSVALGQAWREPVVRATAVFTENALSWLAAQPPIVDVPDKPAQAGARVSEASLGEIARYVLLYMPAAATLLGVAVFLRRRATADGAGRSGRGG